jgi:enoyl-CoA hydratase
VVMDGVVMGGGSGIAMPCRYRIATDRTAFAMPETGIGLFPDVGGGWFLSRLPHEAGTWMALTGARAKAADCLRLGLATHFVAVADLDALKADILAAPDAINRHLADYRADPGPSGFAAIEDRVERAFSADTVEAILDRLDDEGEWGAAQAELVWTKSPTLQKIALRQLREGAKMRTFTENMANEFRIVTRVMAGQDFPEGVRALIVDKDNAPHWRPPELAEVSDQMIDAAFAALPDDQAWRPLPQAREVEPQL